VSVPPTISLSDFVGQVKGSSSHLASRLNESTEPFAWQNDYGVLSVSESHLPTIVRYIEQQVAHHRNQTLDPRLETTAN
jgi:REP element-mobilizing transposase RayT